MKKTTKTALAIGGGIAGAAVLAALWEHFAHASSGPPAPAQCKCPDGTPCPNGDITQCPPAGTSLGQSSESGQTYNYGGSVQANVVQAAQALAAVDPCQCANVAAVRTFQLAAGLTVTGQDDGRYGSNTAAALANVLGVAASAVPAPCATQSWWGAVGTYTNPNCSGDPGP
jgi:hypothetical protein